MRVDEWVLAKKEQDINVYLVICGQGERQFLQKAETERRAIDYARMIVVASMLNLSGVALWLMEMVEGDSKKESVVAYIKEIEKDWDEVAMLVDGFVYSIADKALYGIVNAFWSTKREQIDNAQIRVSQFFE